jgi:hypothetical protein
MTDRDILLGRALHHTTIVIPAPGALWYHDARDLHACDAIGGCGEERCCGPLHCRGHHHPRTKVPPRPAPACCACTLATGLFDDECLCTCHTSARWF